MLNGLEKVVDLKKIINLVEGEEVVEVDIVEN
jgi:hypothetical protein